MDELAQSASNFAELQENWQGVDVNVVARLRNGLTMQGGTSTGRRLEDACAMKASLPEYGTGPSGANTSIAGTQTTTNPYCRIVEPYTHRRSAGWRPIPFPKVDVQMSGTWSSSPGDSPRGELHGDQRRRASPSLGRNLSAGNVTVNLIEPQTFFADRRNNFDFRVAKILRFGRTRTQVGLDVYNLTNTDVVTTYNQTFTSTSWLTPTAIQPARYVKVSAQFDF